MNKQRVFQALEYVKSNPYGKWGILNIEQRRFIKELCNSWLILDEATNNQTKEIERLNNIIKEANELIEEYRYTNVEDYGKIIEFFKKLKTILGKENK